jgi:UDP-N-acetylmuramyl tripeptide synthase
VVLITGKGHERSMLVTGDRKIDWDERGIVRDELAKRWTSGTSTTA